MGNYLSGYLYKLQLEGDITSLEEDKNGANISSIPMPVSDPENKPPVEIGKIPTNNPSSLLSWAYIAIYPSNDHSEVAPLRTLYKSAVKQGYVVYFPKKRFIRRIKCYGLADRIWYESPIIDPLSEKEIGICQGDFELNI